MDRALVTFAVGDYRQLLDISRPTFKKYANRHGYEYVEKILKPGTWSRPPAWFRIPLLQDALNTYDEVLCLGADMIIVDGRQDIREVMPDEAIMGIVGHHTKWGFIPSTEMLYVRPEMLPWLEKAWVLKQYMNHAWWDQAAINHLLGYDPSRFPMEHVAETELYKKTHFLPLEWHSHERFDKANNPRFVEATPGSVDWRRRVMMDYSTRAI